jgi:hypothetical protein
MGVSTVDLNWVLASACRRNEEIFQDIKMMAAKSSAGSPKREFLATVLSDKAWDAVD